MSIGKYHACAILLCSLSDRKFVDTSTGLGAKSQILSSVTPQEEKLGYYFQSGTCLRNPCFTKFSVVNFL